MDVTSTNDALRTSQKSGPPIATTPVSCNLCGGVATDVLFDAKDRLHGCGGRFTYVQCRTCGLVYMNPQIREDCLSLVYPPDYSPHQSKAKPQRAGGRKARSRLKQTPFVLSLCNELHRGSRLLDVGCGSGLFLARMAEATHCEVYGVDSSRAAADIARQDYHIDVFAGTIMDAPFPAEHFDAVTSWWCLEHVANPLQVLRKIHQLLKPGGRCLVGVPNIAGFNARVFGRRWYHLDCPRHLYLYTPDTITKFMDKAGFVVEGIAHYKDTHGLTHSLRYCFGDDGTALTHRAQPPGWRLIKALAHPCTTVLAWLRQSDLIVVSARKNDAATTPSVRDSNGHKSESSYAH